MPITSQAASREVAEIRSAGRGAAECRDCRRRQPQQPRSSASSAATSRDSPISLRAKRSSRRRRGVRRCRAGDQPAPDLGCRRCLRSFGKFFGLAGLRLGFVAGPARSLIASLDSLGDSPGRCRPSRRHRGARRQGVAEARVAGSARWRPPSRAAREARAERRRRHRLFVLAEMNAAEALHRALARRGIWTRTFAAHPHWLRIGCRRRRGCARARASAAAALAALTSRPE